LPYASIADLKVVMSQSVQFSVIIPTYNRLNFLKKAIRSVFAQTHASYEVVVVDDGSTDGTYEYLMSLGSRIRTLHQKNKGPAAARNLGVQGALGTYLAFLDSDDIWFPWTLATFDQVIEQYHQPALISGATLEFEGDTPTARRQCLTAEHFRDYFSSSRAPGYVRSAALVINRETFEAAKGFDERLIVGEDADFYFRIGARYEFVRVLSPVTLAYRRHAGNISTTSSALYHGAIELIRREAKGNYPGGKEREKERWELLGRVIRPVALACLNDGLETEAWNLYQESFKINLRLKRVRFLTGFPLAALFVKAKL
jgi:glycosyltransferase involved in cell wall biosynthesis